VKPTAVIAEDEPLLARQLKTSLARAWPELEVTGVAANGNEAVVLVQRLRHQIVFLDIRMPGLTGLEVAAEIIDNLADGESAPALVFVTAYDEFAVKAFEVAAVDYLLKPVTDERLTRCIARLRTALTQPRDTDAVAAGLRQLPALTPSAARAPLRIIRAGYGDTVKMIPVEEVCYFQASEKYTAVYTKTGEALIRLSLKELLPDLDPAQFAQVHRATIVNLGEVAAAIRDGAGHLSLKLRNRRETLPVSRFYADLFRQM
jgi:DNA-binding LytR/AlgR family response regulator